MMKGSKEFNNILDECLERLLVKGESIEQCLQCYPEQAAELEPLLQTALATREAAAIQPRAEFKARARYQFRSALHEAVSQRSYPFLDWLPRWATTVIMILAVLMVGGGTIAAASYSMPDSLLYPVKLATEQAQLTLTLSDIGKARLCAKFADRRVSEIIYIANKGDTQQIEVIAQRLDKHLVMIASLAIAERGGERVPIPKAPPLEPEPPAEVVLQAADSWAELRILLASYAIKNVAVLRAVLETAPESVKPALLEAIDISEAGYEKALRSLD